MNEIDEIEQAAALAEAETGARAGGAKIPLCMESPKKERSRRWTAEEDAYIRDQHGRIEEDEIAEHLGRTPTAVHLHIFRDLHLTAPSKSPDILTGEQIAWGLGVDGKTVHLLMDSGRMPHRRLPGNDVTRVIDRRALLLWIIEPKNWIYFKTDRVGAMRQRGNRSLSVCYDFKFWEGARKIVQKARAKWRDEWLTPRQAAAAIGRTGKAASHNINKAILCGNLKATRWGNWHILRSDMPGKDMTINVLGRIVRTEEIGKHRCRRCGKMGHNRNTCARIAAALEKIKGGN